MMKQLPPMLSTITVLPPLVIAFACSVVLTVLQGWLSVQAQAQMPLRDSLMQELRRAESKNQRSVHTANLRLQLALWYMAHDQNDTTAMLGYLHAARDDERFLRDKRFSAEYYLAAGNIARRMYRNTEALRLLDTAITMHSELGQRSRVAYALSRIGLVFHQQHLYEIALEYHLAALYQAQMSGDSSVVLTQCINLADLYLRIGRIPQARELAQRGLRIVERMKADDRRAGLLTLQAEILLREGRYASALAATDSAVALTTALGLPDDAQYALLTRGTILQARGDVRAAMAIYRSIANTEIARRGSMSAWTAWHLACALYEQGKQSDNKNLVREAIVVAEDMLRHPKLEQHNEKLYDVLARAYQWLGDSSSMFRVQQQSIDFQDSLLRLSMATRVSGLRDYYQLQQYHEQQALLKQERMFIAITVGIVLCAVALIAWLQWHRSRLKQKTASLLQEKNEELVAVNEDLKQAHEQLQAAYRQIADSQQSLEQQHRALARMHSEQEERKHLLSEAYDELDTAYQEVMARQAELEQQNAELARLNNEKNELMGIMAHDLKNPLSQIRSMIELVADDHLDDDTRKNLLTASLRAADRMFELISMVLEVNRLERGGLELHPERVDMNSLVALVVNSFQPAASQKNITLHYVMPPSVSQHGIVFADQAASHRVVENLLSNAIKYSPLGRNVWVSVECLSVGTHSVTESILPTINNQSTNHQPKVVRVRIRDEGPGISEHDKKRLFGKFARLSARPTAKESSTGLGLSIVKSLVEAMNGRVWCESAPESGVPGATFVVELPAAD
jgi:signal transduction histidine kinase